MAKVSCLMPTKGRFRLACRSIAFFLMQSYKDKELIVYNQSPVPMVGEIADLPSIKIINTTKQYTSMYDIYNDALEHCTGELLNIMDDDNGCFPWLLQETIAAKTKRACKTDRSWVWSQDRLTLQGNVLEPSIVMDRDVITEFGFDKHRSLIHKPWFWGLANSGELQHLGPEYVPGLVYCWGETGAGAWHISSTGFDGDAGFEGFDRNSRDYGADVKGRIELPNVIQWWDRVTYEHTGLRRKLGLEVAA